MANPDAMNSKLGYGAFLATADRPPWRDGIIKLAWPGDGTAHEEYSIHPPDNRTVSDLLADDVATSVFVTTAELSDGVNFKAGSALWHYHVPSKSWHLLMELPCCTSVWSSLGIHKLAGAAKANFSFLEEVPASPSTGPNDGKQQQLPPAPQPTNVGAAVGLAVGLSLLALCAAVVAVAYCRYRRIVKQRREALLAMYRKQAEEDDEGGGEEKEVIDGEAVTDALRACKQEEASQANDTAVATSGEGKGDPKQLATALLSFSTRFAAGNKSADSVTDKPARSLEEVSDALSSAAEAIVARLEGGADGDDGLLIPLELVEGLLGDLAAVMTSPTPLSSLSTDEKMAGPSREVSTAFAPTFLADTIRQTSLGGLSQAKSAITLEKSQTSLAPATAVATTAVQLKSSSLQTLSQTKLASAVATVATEGDGQAQEAGEEDPVPIALMEGQVDDAGGALVAWSLGSNANSSRPASTALAPTFLADTIRQTSFGAASQATASAAALVAGKAAAASSVDPLKRDSLPKLSPQRLCAVVLTSAKVAKHIARLPSMYFGPNGTSTMALLPTPGSTKTAGRASISVSAFGGATIGSTAVSSDATLVASFQSLLAAVPEGTDPASLQPSSEHVLGAILAGALKKASELQAEGKLDGDSSKSTQAIEEAALEAGHAAIIGAYDRRRAAVQSLPKRPRSVVKSGLSATGAGSVIIAAGGAHKRQGRSSAASYGLNGPAAGSDKSFVPAFRRRPDWAELERRYGKLEGIEAPPPPPSFVGFLASFVGQHVAQLLNRCIKRKPEPRKGNGSRFSVVVPTKAVPSAAAKALAAHYGQGGADNERAAFAALGLDQDASGAFVASNDLLRARAENLVTTTVAQPGRQAAVSRAKRKGSVLADNDHIPAPALPSSFSYSPRSSPTATATAAGKASSKSTAFASFASSTSSALSASPAVVINPLAALAHSK
jgi:trimeric autotransporter adhesin